MLQLVYNACTGCVCSWSTAVCTVCVCSWYTVCIDCVCPQAVNTDIPGSLCVRNYATLSSFKSSPTFSRNISRNSVVFFLSLVFVCLCVCVRARVRARACLWMYRVISLINQRSNPELENSSCIHLLVMSVTRTWEWGKGSVQMFSPTLQAGKSAELKTVTFTKQMLVSVRTVCKGYL